MPSGEGGSPAETNAFKGWVAPLTVMMFVLGAFVALALKTQNRVRTDNLPSSSYTGLAQAYWSLGRTIRADHATIENLRDTNTQLTDTVAHSGSQSGVVAETLKQAQFMAGLTAVTGPGVVVTLSDSKRAPAETNGIAIPPSILASFIIHDRDIANVINELRAGGGEVYSVNNERVISTTAIRCVGPAIQVNGVPMTPPYKIKAVGDPSTLYTTLNLTGGIVDSYKIGDPAMISVQKSSKLIIPAYDGAEQFRFAKPINLGTGGKDEVAAAPSP